MNRHHKKLLEDLQGALSFATGWDDKQAYCVEIPKTNARRLLHRIRHYLHKERERASETETTLEAFREVIKRYKP